jgi:hypothetical protein
LLYTSSTTMNCYVYNTIAMYCRSRCKRHARSAKGTSTQACSSAYACSAVAAVSLSRRQRSCQSCCYQAGSATEQRCTAHTSCRKVSLLHFKLQCVKRCSLHYSIALLHECVVYSDLCLCAVRVCIAYRPTAVLCVWTSA